MKRKILFTIILFIMILITFFSTVKAGDIHDIFSGADDFLNSGVGGEQFIDQQDIKNTSNTIYNILLVIGIVIAVIIASILGIKFMIGSVEEKSQIKEALIPFVIGCVVVFGAFGIWKIFVQIGNSL